LPDATLVRWALRVERFTADGLALVVEHGHPDAAEGVISEFDRLSRREAPGGLAPRSSVLF